MEAPTPAWAVHLPAGGDPAGVDLLAEGTLPRAWARRFAADPTRPVLWEDSRGWVSAGAVDAASRRVAARFHRAGLRPGDRVLMSAATSIGLIEAHVGALRLGLVVVPANTAYQEREIAHLVADAQPKAAVVDDPQRGRWISVAAGADTSPIVVGPEVALPEGPVVDVDTAGPDDPAVIGYTSGTTGAPKGAVLTHANLLASSESVRLAWRWGTGDRLVLRSEARRVGG